MREVRRGGPGEAGPMGAREERGEVVGDVGGDSWCVGGAGGCPGEKGAAAAVSAFPLPRALGGRLCLVPLEPSSCPQDSVPASSEASVFHSVKWGESLHLLFSAYQGLLIPYRNFLGFIFKLLPHLLLLSMVC